MKRNTLIKTTLAISVLSALILTGGCQSMNKDAAVTCPKCDKKVATFHPKKGMTYKKIACPSCKMVTVVDSATGTATATHACDACGTLVGKCAKCSSM